MIEKGLLKRILAEDVRYKSYICRNIEIKDISKVYTIIGPRRAGKTYFLYQIRDHLIKKGIKKNQILYINFEDERLIDFSKNDFQTLLDAYYELSPENIEKHVFIMLDEIQNVSGWSKFVRRIYETSKYTIFITGSSSKLLSKEIATELRGRTWIYFIYPFSFEEYLRANDCKVNERDFYGSLRPRIVSLLDKFLEHGSFPETIHLDTYERIKVLQDYYNTMLFRDIIERYNISDISLVRKFMKYIMELYSRTFSVNAFYKFIRTMGFSVGKDKLYDFMQYLEDSYYVFFVEKYMLSPKKQMTSPRKVYIIDNGLIRAISSTINENRGYLFENIVFIQLKRMGYEVFYFKEKGECDFIYIKDKKMGAIQVTLKPEKEREVDGLIEAMESLNLKNGTIITENDEREMNINGKKILLIPLFIWLLKFS